MKNSDRFTVLVCSSDGYEDLWEPFFTLFKKNWPECSSRIVLNTESRRFSPAGVKLDFIEGTSLSNLTYGSRMIHHLENIETEYTLLLLDDFFIRDKVNENLLHEYIEIMDEDDMITSINFDPTPRNGMVYHNDAKLLELPQVAPYKLNMQAGIWKTKDLLKYWNKLDSPWQWEIFGNYDTFSSKDKFLHISSLEYSPINYGFVNGGWGVYRGKWVVSDVDDLFVANDIHIDYLKRGIFDDDSTALFNDKKALTSYLFKRLKFKYFVGFLFFKMRKKFGQLPEYRTHTDYLSRK